MKYIRDWVDIWLEDRRRDRMIESRGYDPYNHIGKQYRAGGYS